MGSLYLSIFLERIIVKSLVILKHSTLLGRSEPVGEISHHLQWFSRFFWEEVISNYFLLVAAVREITPTVSLLSDCAILPETRNRSSVGRDNPLTRVHKCLIKTLVANAQ